MAVLPMSRPYKHPKTGIYWFRAKVPAALRSVANKELVTWTLMTKDQGEATRRWPDALRKWEVMKAAWVRATNLEALTEERAREIAQGWAAWIVAGGKLAMAGVTAPDLWDREGMARFEECVPRHMEEALEQAGVSITEDSRPLLLRVLSPLVLTAYWDARHDHQEEASGFRTVAPQLQQIVPKDILASVKVQPQANAQLTFDAAWEAWKAVTPSSPRTVDDALRVLRQLQAFVGHQDVAKVTREDVLRWREAVKAAGKSNTTWNNRLSYVSEVFKRAVADGRLQSNPADGLRLEKGRTAERMPYSAEEVVRILQAARGEATPALRWSHWIMAFTGMRVGEVLQLTAGDVKVDEKSGIQFFDVRPDPMAGKSVKNGQARHIPIHPALVTEGFLEFVADSRRHGQDAPLFPEKGLDKYGRRGGRAWNLVGKWVKKAAGITDPAKAPNHSWRHRMEDELRDEEVPEDVRDAIMGHQRRTTGRLYGVKGEALSRLHRELSKVRAPSGLFRA